MGIQRSDNYRNFIMLYSSFRWDKEERPIQIHITYGITERKIVMLNVVSKCADKFYEDLGFGAWWVDANRDLVAHRISRREIEFDKE